jgi:hypothetical protein
LLGSKTTGDTTGSGASQSKTNVFGNNDWRGGHLICMCMHKISEKDTSGCPYKPCQCLFEWMGACWKVHGGKATQVTRQIRHAILITCHQPDRCIWTKSLGLARTTTHPTPPPRTGEDVNTMLAPRKESDVPCSKCSYTFQPALHVQR